MLDRAGVESSAAAAAAAAAAADAADAADAAAAAPFKGGSAVRFFFGLFWVFV